MLDGKRLDALVSDEAFLVREAGQNVFPFHPGIAGNDCRSVVPSFEHTEDVLDGEPVATGDRFATEDSGINGDSREKVFFSHE